MKLKRSLNARVLLDYDKLCELKSSGKLRKFRVGQGEGKSQYIEVRKNVEADTPYESPASV